MLRRKMILNILFLALFFLCAKTVALAESLNENVTIFYKDVVGKKLVLEKANDINIYLNNLDAVNGDFSQENIRELEMSNHIKAVHTSNKKLKLKMTTLSSLPYATFTTNWSQTLIQSTLAWRKGLNGQAVKVGIIDTAVAEHSNLPNIHRKNFAAEANLSSNASEHGTFVAGIIAAQPLTYANMFGVAPGVDLYSMNVDGASGGNLVDVIAAIDYAISKKLQIVNISMGIPAGDLLDVSEKLEENPLYIAVKIAQENGILFVAATGNQSTVVDYPAAFPGVVSVGAVNEKKVLSDFSNRGPEMDVVAPGSSIQSLDYTNGFRIDSGTSFSSPFVVGLLAILKQEFPNETNAQLVQRLTSSAEDLGEAGFDSKYGYGLAKYTEQSEDTPKLETTSALEVNEAEKKTEEIIDEVEDEIKPVVETAAQKYVRTNKLKITKIVKKIDADKKLNYLTEYAPIYSVYDELTKTQKRSFDAYRKKNGSITISKWANSKDISATNISNLKKKKTSKLTFNDSLKVSTIQSSAFVVYKDGTKVKNFKVTKTKNGRSVIIKTTKTLTSGVYWLAVDTKNFRTKKNKKVKSYMVGYYVK